MTYKGAAIRLEVQAEIDIIEAAKRDLASIADRQRNTPNIRKSK